MPITKGATALAAARAFNSLFEMQRIQEHLERLRELKDFQFSI